MFQPKIVNGEAVLGHSSLYYTVEKEYTVAKNFGKILSFFFSIIRGVSLGWRNKKVNFY